jgi:uncharacterized repeat protein (TIGR04076 family)
MKKLKITVVRKVCHQDLIDKYENPIEHACDMEEGQHSLPTGGRNPKACAKVLGKPSRPSLWVWRMVQQTFTMGG